MYRIARKGNENMYYNDTSCRHGVVLYFFLIYYYENGNGVLKNDKQKLQKQK